MMRHWSIPVASILLLIPVGLLTSPHAEAADYSSPEPAYNVVTIVTWAGGDGCIDLLEPFDGDLHQTGSCDPEGVITRVTAYEGDWVGIDPVDESGTAIVCTLTVDGVTMISHAGFANTDCLAVL